MKTLPQPSFNIDDIVMYNDGYNIKIGKILKIEYIDNFWMYQTTAFYFSEYESANIDLINRGNNYIIHSTLLEVKN